VLVVHRPIHKCNALLRVIRWRRGGRRQRGWRGTHATAAHKSRPAPAKTVTFLQRRLGLRLGDGVLRHNCCSVRDEVAICRVAQIHAILIGHLETGALREDGSHALPLVPL
jgi:hypothetical protein